MVVKNKKAAQNFLAERLHQANGIVSKFEKEVEKAIKSVRTQGKRSTKKIMKSFDEIIDRLGAGDIKNMAVEKTDELRKEIVKISDEIVSTIRGIELGFDRTMFKTIRQSLTGLVQKVQDLEIVEFAKGKVADTKNQVLTFLHIPSLADLDTLARKVVSLERKLGLVASHERRGKKSRKASVRKAA